MKGGKKIMTGKLVLSQQDVVRQTPSLSHYQTNMLSKFHLVHLHLEIWMLAEDVVCLGAKKESGVLLF